jgi:hypothetical protein
MSDCGRYGIASFRLKFKEELFPSAAFSATTGKPSSVVASRIVAAIGSCCIQGHTLGAGC